MSEFTPTASRLLSLCSRHAEAQTLIPLIGATEILLEQRAIKRRHHIASGVMCRSMCIHLGLNLSCQIGVCSTCAEIAAIAAAQLAHPEEIILLVAVRRNFESESNEIIPPCGRCREVLLNYGPDSRVALELHQSIALIPVRDLLVFPFQRQG